VISSGLSTLSAPPEVDDADEIARVRACLWTSCVQRSGADPGDALIVRIGQAVGMAEGTWYAGDIDRVIVTEDEIKQKIAELAKRVAEDYAGRDGLLLVGVLKGAVMFMADFSRALGLPVELEFMAVSSYGQGATSSGTVRILKDLDRDISGRNVIVVEDIVDSGLTLSWLLRYLTSRNPASVEVVTLLRKPEAVRVDIRVKYVGFDIPNEFVVGYGLDYAEQYRELPYVAVLKPEVYRR
jgi:hypoxanthine phosphoribosyltransferase